MNESSTDDDDSHLNDAIKGLDLSQMNVDEEQDDDNGSETSSSSATPVLPTTSNNRKTSPAEDSSTTIPQTQNGMQKLKRFLPGSSAAKQSDSSANGNNSKNKTSSKATKEELAKVKVNSLPKRFFVKYLGNRPCDGLWGIKVVRGPVDDMVAELKLMDKQNDDLPLIQVNISAVGINVTLHRSNKSLRPLTSPAVMPIEFIPYAVQDTRYGRVCSFVLVREMSSRTRTTECHAYLCDSEITARRLALSMALAFKTYEKGLDGKPHRFQVALNADESEANGGRSKKSGTATATNDKKLAECDA